MRKSYFFCGIGGSGMSPLAAIIVSRGSRAAGSDRARDRGDSPDKFRALESLGIKLFPQDGSGVKDIDALVVSTAIEDSIPDVKAAKDKNIPIIRRAELLASLFNESKTGIAVAGTSGKSTVTGMIAVMLTEAGLDPTVMNGGVIRNFETPARKGLPNMRTGQGDAFVTECDESDGSIALYNPAIAVLNNISLDHKSVEELEALFGDFISRAKTAAVLNFDDARVRALAGKSKAPVYSYGLSGGRFTARDIKLRADGVSFTVHDDASGESAAVVLNVPGEHNVSNALAAIAAAKAAGVSFADSAKTLASFKGTHRRLEVVGTQKGITVIDDFAHNPDKIAASLNTLKHFPGRLLVIFQPHGFGPLKLMGREIAETFAAHFDSQDMLLMPEAYYAGGTADCSVTAKHVIDMVTASGRKAQWFEKRADILPFVQKNAAKGDRIIVMGARDDTLSVFAQEIISSF